MAKNLTARPPRHAVRANLCCDFVSRGSQDGTSHIPRPGRPAATEPHPAGAWWSRSSEPSCHSPVAVMPRARGAHRLPCEDLSSEITCQVGSGAVRGSMSALDRRRPRESRLRRMESAPRQRRRPHLVARMRAPTPSASKLGATGGAAATSGARRCEIRAGFLKTDGCLIGSISLGDGSCLLT